MEKRRKDGLMVEDERGAAIMLLVEHTHSIPVRPFSSANNGRGNQDTD